ncbi:MAG: apolipoprotein N-acyltransferase [Myxococcota bacterium]
MGSSRFAELRGRAARPAPWLALLAGVILAASVVPEPAPAFSLLFFVPFRVALERGPAGFRRGLWLGWLTGFSCNVWALDWVIGVLEAFGGFPFVLALPTAALLWAAQALTFALATGLAEALRARGGPWWAHPLALALVFAGAPALFPWRPATGAVGWLPLAQAAELGGPPLLDLIVLLSGAALAETLLRPRRAPALVGALVLGAALGGGALRLETIRARRSAAPALSVGIVQPNIPVAIKNDAQFLAGHLATLQDATARLEARDAELVVWPETAYPYGLPRDARREPRGPRGLHGRGARGPLLAGVLTYGGRCERWNSVISLSPGGNVRGVSDKVELIAFGEYVPLWHWLPPLRAYFPCPGLTPGERPRVLEAAGARVGVLNCYEDVLPGRARVVAADDPELLVNVTNDAWFGRTAEPYLHDLVARVRAIEARKDLVRAVNTGVSSHVAATGETLASSATFVPAEILADARRLRGRTFWVRVGDVQTPALTLLLTWVAWSRRRFA